MKILYLLIHYSNLSVDVLMIYGKIISINLKTRCFDYMHYRIFYDVNQEKYLKILLFRSLCRIQYFRIVICCCFIPFTQTLLGAQARSVSQLGNPSPQVSDSCSGSEEILDITVESIM